MKNGKLLPQEGGEESNRYKANPCQTDNQAYLSVLKDDNNEGTGERNLVSYYHNKGSHSYTFLRLKAKRPSAQAR